MSDYLSEVKKAAASGVSLICATCHKYIEAKTRGLDKCLAEGFCGSPIVGDTFQEYQGPITDFLRFCFVCGGTATKGIRVKGHQRMIGACSTHVDYVVTQTPKMMSPGLYLPVPPKEGRVTVLSDEAECLAESMAPKTKKSLAGMMAEINAGTFHADNE